MYKLTLAISLYLFSLQAYASSLKLAPIEIDEYLPIYNEEKEQYECGGKRLQGADKLNKEQTFALYAMLYLSAESIRKIIPFRKIIYTSMHSHFSKELHADVDVSISEKNEGHLLVTLPFHKNVAWDQWLRRLATERKHIQGEMCELKWFESQLEKLNQVPMEYVYSYNTLLTLHEEFESRCKKPEIVGWTRSQEAKDYVICLRKRKKEYKKKLKKLNLPQISQTLRIKFVPILKDLGLIDKLKIPQEARRK
jgi:hypothetical protein